MQKKLSKILVLIVMVCLTFAGCTFLTIDPVKFYSATVATVGDEKITRQDLRNAYESYGYYYYVYQQKKTPAEAIKETLNTEIDKKMLFNYCVKTKNYTLTDDEMNELWNDVYNYFDSLYANYKSKAYDRLDITDPDTNEKQKNIDSAFKAYEPYKKSAEISWEKVDGKTIYTIIDADNDEEDSTDIVIGINWSDYTQIVGDPNSENYTNYIKTVWAKYTPSITENIYNECYNLAVKDLVYKNRYVRENGKALSTEPEEVILREVKRIYWQNYVAQMIGKLQDEYDKLPNKYDANAILTKYKDLVEESYIDYNASKESNLEKYDGAMVGESAKADKVYYHPNNNYFYVNNLLLGFDTDQKAMVTREKATRSEADFNDWLADYANEKLLNNDKGVKIHDLETGEITGTTSAQYVLNYINNNLNGSNYDKANLFNTAIYMYGTDPGMYNASMPYIDSKDNTSMVTEFNKAGVKLDEAGVYGKISGLVLTEYGYHILFYAGKVNPVANNSALRYDNLNNITLQDLAETTINYTSNKTLFDLMFDQVYGDYASKYSAYEEKLLDLISQTVEVHIYKSVRDTALKNV